MSSEACPVTGRSAIACADQTHAGCWPGHLAAIRLDRQIERMLP